jgi:fermentation-respiration switch protein FrsA (DUF1100 family)
MNSNKIQFVGSAGGSLAARLDEPEATTRAHALFAHCFTCSKDIAAANRIARRLSQQGIGVLRFDFTGLGHSDGEFENAGFASNIEDVVVVAQWLRENKAAPKILIGHSLGGAAVLAAAHRIPESVAVATIGAPVDPEHVLRLFGSSVDEIEQQGRAEVSIGGRPFTIAKSFLDQFRSHDQTEAIQKLDRALMIFHAPLDDIVGIENAARIFELARHPKSFVSLDTADHLLRRNSDAVYVAEVIAAWAERYIDER